MPTALLPSILLPESPSIWILWRRPRLLLLGCTPAGSPHHTGAAETELFPCGAKTAPRTRRTSVQKCAQVCICGPAKCTEDCGQRLPLPPTLKSQSTGDGDRSMWGEENINPFSGRILLSAVRKLKPRTSTMLGKPEPHSRPWRSLERGGLRSLKPPPHRGLRCSHPHCPQHCGLRADFHK